MLCLDSLDWTNDKYTDPPDLTNDNYPFLYTLDRARKVAINSYVFANFLIAIERTLATIMLKSYEDFKHPCIIVLSILIPWIAGLGMHLLVVIGNFPQIIWIII